MPSLITSVIGGVQGASAAHHAADYMQTGYKQAGETVNKAVDTVNPEILEAARQAGVDVKGAAATAGQGVTTAATAAGTGATDAARKLYDLLSTYMKVGADAAGGLGEAAKPFTADMMRLYSPAYQFQLQQGTQAMDRMAAAGGLTGSGGTMKSLQRYTQDYAGTAFKNASDLYGKNFDRLSTLANMGMGASTTAGAAGLDAAKYAGNAGMSGAEYAGNMGMRGEEFAGTSNINARNLASNNTLSAANYLANTQIGSQKARAEGDLGAASSWNNMLTGIGKVGDTVLMGGMGSGAEGEDAWSWSNIPKNVWGKK